MTSTLRSVPAPGGALAVLDRPVPDPDGPPVVLLHAGALDHRMWRPQLDAFPGRRLVAPDARGHGRSSTAFAPYRLCDDVVTVLDALEIDRAVLVGVSMGGGTAVDVALEHPSRVAGLVVSGTDSNEPAFRDPWTVGVLARRDAAGAAGDPDGWVAASMEFVPGPHRSPERVDPDVWALVERMTRETLAAHVLVGDDGVPLPPLPPTPVAGAARRLAEIGAPVVGVAGALDSDDHLRLCRELTEAVPDGRFVTIDDAAHFVSLEQPVAFDGAVEELLRRTGSRVADGAA